MLTKAYFEKLFSLIRVQPWLVEKTEEIDHLLIEECGDSDEQELIWSLLSRFKYLTHDDFNASLVQIVSSITSEERYEQNNTTIVATTLNSVPDSAQYVIYQMKPLFQKCYWDKAKLVNNSNKIIREFPERKNVIYVDEFVGSGSTILNRIRKLKNELKYNGYREYSVRVYSVAASRVGELLLKENGIEFFCNTIVPKGISDYYANTKDEKINLMKRLEELLSLEYDDRQMPSLGYGEVESLYARQYGNSPNNVFPVFWWPFYLNNERRPTILIRAMGDA